MRGKGREKSKSSADESNQSRSIPSALVVGRTEEKNQSRKSHRTPARRKAMGEQCQTLSDLRHVRLPIVAGTQGTFVGDLRRIGRLDLMRTARTRRETRSSQRKKSPIGYGQFVK